MQPVIRKLALRILVQRLQIGMRRRGVEIEIALLDVFAVIALRTGQAEEPLLENRIPLFHSASAKHSRHSRSQIPRSPSSPQR